MYALLSREGRRIWCRERVSLFVLFVEELQLLPCGNSRSRRKAKGRCDVRTAGPLGGCSLPSAQRRVHGDTWRPACHLELAAVGMTHMANRWCGRRLVSQMAGKVEVGLDSTPKITESLGTLSNSSATPCDFIAGPGSPACQGRFSDAAVELHISLKIVPSRYLRVARSVGRRKEASPRFWAWVVG